MRTWLLPLVPAPPSTLADPLVQLWHHLRLAFDEASDPLAELKLRTQQPLLG